MHFASEQQIDDLWAAFTSGTLPKLEWTHQAHVAIAGILVWRDPETAIAQARQRITSLNEHQGTVNSATNGYHETITVFWIRVVQAFCAPRRGQTRLAVINELVEKFPRDFFKQYYSYDVVKSEEARRVWIAPDLHAID